MDKGLVRRAESSRDVRARAAERSVCWIGLGERSVDALSIAVVVVVVVVCRSGREPPSRGALVGLRESKYKVRPGQSK